MPRLIAGHPSVGSRALGRGSARLGPALVTVGLLVLVALLALATMSGRLGWFDRYPASWVIDPAPAIDAFLRYVSRDLAVGTLKVSDITRAISAVVGAPVGLLVSGLTDGLYVTLPGGAEVAIPPVPWILPAALMVLVPYRVAGMGASLLALLTVAYVLVSGLWVSTLTTLVSVLLSVTLASTLGVLLGIASSFSRRLSLVLEPVYDATQTVPIFSYLAVILVFFGFGTVAALTATVLFAMVPMARATELALRQTPQSIQDLARISGCTPPQRLFLVLLPTSRQDLLLGLNQVTVLSLAMVIVASIIGAGGLGADVLRALKSLRLAEALQAGLAISLIAISIDRTLRAWATRSRQVGAPGVARRGVLFWCLLLLGAATCAAWFDARLLYHWDRPLIQFGTYFGQGGGQPGGAVLSGLKVAQGWFVGWILLPYRDAVSGLPWGPVAVAATVSIGALANWRTALTCGALLVLLAALGLWDRAMLSLYLVSLSLLAAFLMGFPLGVLVGLSNRAYAVTGVLTDIVQTLPTFVYLIPVVMLFGAGDFPAFVAIVVYLVAPIVRYTAAGIQSVPAGLREAAEMAGCTVYQKITYLLLPVAAPQLILGVNQAVMLGFGMLVITALVGSRGLEEVTLVAISKVQPGSGLVAGFGISALAIVVDRLLRGASGRLARRTRLVAP